jgi:integrase
VSAPSWIAPVDAARDGAALRLAVRSALAGAAGRPTLAARVVALRRLGRLRGVPYLAGLRPVKVHLRAPAYRTAAEVGAIIDALEGDARVAAELAYGCGLTATEIAALRFEAIDIEARTIALPRGLVPLSAHAGAAIQPFRAVGPVLPRAETASTVRRILPVPARELRDCAALHMLIAGADAATVGAWLGVSAMSVERRLGQAVAALRGARR